MIIVNVSLSFASWNGAVPQTSMYKITPRDQISEKNQINRIKWDLIRVGLDS